MNRSAALFVLILLGLFAWPSRCPAPLVYTPGEGWTYETPGGSKWQRGRAKDQYEYAQQAFDNKKFKLAIKAARRTVARWPLSEFAPQAQYLVGLAYEARKWDEKAFKEYQKAVEKYPKITNYEELLQRQFGIAQRFLGGQWFKLWGVIPFFPSMEKTADMFAKIVRNGPYSKVGPDAQMAIGTTREKQKDYYLAVKAYEKAADTYHDDPKIAAEALFRAAEAYLKQAKTAEYDQGAAASAIGTYTDFITLYPNDPRVAKAQATILELRTEQAEGAFRVAQFYEKKRRWDGARVYYNEVVSKDPNSQLAAASRRRLATLSKAPPTPLPASPDMLRFSLLASVILLFASGCAGYRMGPTAGFEAGSRTIRVNYFANHTLQPRLSEAVAQALRKRLQQDGTYRLVSAGDADVVVNGDIMRFDRSPVSFQPSDVRTTRDEELELAVKLVAADRLAGTNLVDREIVGRMVVRLGSDQTSAERQALTQLAEDFANRAAPLIVDGTW